MLPLDSCLNKIDNVRKRPPHPTPQKKNMKNCAKHIFLVLH